MTQGDPSILSLDVSHRFDLPRTRIFDAWLQPSWCEWLPPKDASCKVLSMHPETGGTFLLDMIMPDGRAVQIAGRYLEIVRPSRIVLSWTGSYDERESIITVTFDEDGDGTMMKLNQQGFADTFLRDGYRTGWTASGGPFDKLADLLSRRV